MVKAMEEYLQRIIADMLIVLHFVHAILQVKERQKTLCISYGAEYGIDVVIARPCHVYGPGFTESDNRVRSIYS